MNKPLIFTAALMSAALVAGAAVDAEKICNFIKRRKTTGSGTWAICSRECLSL